MGKAARVMMADELINSAKKGTITPSPQDYKVNREYTMPNTAKGGGSLLQA